MPPRGIAPQMAGHAWKGAGEVTPKGLYFRKGRVDEHSEIYPVCKKPTRNPTPLGVVLSLIPHAIPPLMSIFVDA